MHMSKIYSNNTDVELATSVLHIRENISIAFSQFVILHNNVHIIITRYEMGEIFMLLLNK